jgi:cytochrome c biogenesis protein CcmG/thiol:disulfide interchange protein DsbE
MLLALLPLLLFIILAGAFGYQLLYGNDPETIPSALLGKPVPDVIVPPLKPDKPGFGAADFGQEPVLVNVFASWCIPCRAEHPVITALAQDWNIPVYGLNSKDQREDALAWLEELGDPYTRIGYDPTGRAGIDWGVYGYPETFLINDRGQIIYKYVGPITKRVLEHEFLPRIKALRAQ